MQVVLFGDAGDDRPYRLLWPSGTLLFVVGASASLVMLLLVWVSRFTHEFNIQEHYAGNVSALL